jgi:hypothetical protein
MTPAPNALDEPFSAFPSSFMRITCDRCGQDRMLNEAHMPRSSAAWAEDGAEKQGGGHASTSGTWGSAMPKDAGPPSPSPQHDHQDLSKAVFRSGCRLS